MASKRDVEDAFIRGRDVGYGSGLQDGIGQTLKVCPAVETLPGTYPHWEWWGTHRDIQYKVVCWTNGLPDDRDVIHLHWNYYVMLYRHQIPDLYEHSKQETPERVFRNTSWHGGMTYSSFRSATDYKHDVIEWLELGCDYGHYFDEGNNIRLTTVHAECISTINDLRDTFGDEILYHDRWDGSYDTEENIEARKLQRISEVTDD